jgi:hypothetical protein
MLSPILANTPIWVFGLFFVLLALGVLQMRPRKTPLRRIIISPVVFLVLSFVGVVTAFGVSAEPVLAWLAGYLLSAYATRQVSSNVGSRFDATTRTVHLAGSSLPLVLMMSIFAIKYFVGASTGMHASFTLHPHFPAAASVLYGVCSGAFAGRAWRLFELTRSQRIPSIYNR